MDKPAFDPSQPFQVGDKPPFDPSQPFDAAPSVGMGEDIAKSAGSGLASAAIGTLGSVGDIRDLASRGVDAIAPKLGIDPSTIKNAANAASYALPGGRLVAGAPNSQDIKSTVTDPIVSPDYQPQTFAGKVTKTGAEFLPAMAGGPESLAAKFATRVAVPALASETAGALTNDNPYAKIGGALLGGAGASKIGNAFNEAAAVRAAAPSLADTKSAATNVYDRLTTGNAASPIPQAELDTLASDIRTKLNGAGVRPSNAKGIHDALDELQNPATKGAADVQDLVAARESIKNQLGSPDASKKGAFIALPKIEAAIERLSPGTMKDLKEADKNYGAFKASEALDKKAASADLRAAAVDSGMNVGNKIRQKVASLLESGDAKYLSAENKADLEKIVRGTWTQNGMRQVANLFGGGGGLGMLAGGTAGYEAGGLPGMAAGVALGRGFKIANNRSIVKQAEQVSRAIRQRSPLGQQNPLVLPQMTNPLLSASIPALLSARRQLTP